MMSDKNVSCFELAKRLRVHVLGPVICDQCGYHRKDPDGPEDCEGQCAFFGYGTHTSHVHDIWKFKEDALLAAEALERSQAP